MTEQPKVCGLKASVYGSTQLITDLPKTITEYIEQCRLNGQAKETINRMTQVFKQINKHSDLTNPYEIREYLANQTWKNSTKTTVTTYFTGLYKHLQKEWKPPKYIEVTKYPFIPTNEECLILINSARSNLKTEEICDQCPNYYKCLQTTLERDHQ